MEESEKEILGTYVPSRSLVVFIQLDDLDLIRQEVYFTLSIHGKKTRQESPRENETAPMRGLY